MNHDLDAIDWVQLRQEADQLLSDLFPICRSLTGDGVRQTLSRLREITDFQMKEIPSGTKCYDWIIPDEWNIREAFIEDAKGKRIIDFANNNLHVVNYSMPIDALLPFEELNMHVHTLPDQPNAIPYRTTYYKKEWGFSMAYAQWQTLDHNMKYRVRIDATLEPGHLNWGEYAVQGSSGQEFLISSYCCHPSLGNDNLSGIVLWTLLLRELRKKEMRHTYRFVIVPETIGAIAYLSLHEEAMKSIDGGFIITTVAGPGTVGYKETFLGNHLIDRAVRCVFREEKREYIHYPFDVTGSDETHYSAPYFRIPIGTICRDKYFEYDEYHTSLDNLTFIRADHLIDTLRLYLRAIDILERNVIYRSLCPQCEPQFGKRGLYPDTGGFHKTKNYDVNYRNLGNALDHQRWLMFLSDGKTSLLDIAERTGLPMKGLAETAENFERHHLLEVVPFAP